MKCPKCGTPTEPVVHGRNISAQLCAVCNVVYERRRPDSLPTPKRTSR